MEQATTPPPPPPPPPPPAPAHTDDYPVKLAIEYPDRDLSRLTTFFRFFVAIPILIVLGMISGGTYNFDWGGANDASSTFAAAGGFLFAAPLVMILFREKYPRWWFDWNVGLYKFTLRAWTYAHSLMTDAYPSTDEEQHVRLEVEYPNVQQDLNRWLPLVKWLLAIPHYIVLFFLIIGAFFAVFIAWFAILFTARYPRGLFDFVEGVYRWHIRVAGYAFLLVTDKYPPFRLGP